MNQLACIVFMACAALVMTEPRTCGLLGDFLGHFPSLGFLGHHHQGAAFPVVQNSGDFTAANAQRFPNSDPGKRVVITPYKTTNQTIYKRIVCTGGPVQEISLNMTDPNSDITCNGYDAWVSPWTYASVVNGQAQDLTIGNFSQYYTYLNGNMYEVNFGQITGGVCAGDNFFSANAYVADDQLGCSGQGLRSVSIDYINAKISGNKCNQQCTLDTRHHSFFAFNPPITN